MILRHVLIAVFAAAAAVLPARPALAEGPIKEPFPLEPVTFPAGLVCPFEVTLEAINNREALKIFPSGRVTVSGHLTTRVTNEATGESIDVETSGPATITGNPDGSITVTARGQFLFFFFPGDLGPGTSGALLLTSGRAIEVAASDFSVIHSFSVVGGTTENLCLTLA